MKWKMFILIMSIFLIPLFSQVPASENYSMSRQGFLNGNDESGPPPASENFTLMISAGGGQADSGVASESFILLPGFLSPDAVLIPGCTDPIAINYDPTAGIDDGSCEYGISGDLDGDQSLTILDIVILVGIILGEDSTPYQQWAGDLDGSGTMDVLDIVLLVDLILHPPRDGFRDKVELGVLKKRAFR